MSLARIVEAGLVPVIRASTVELAVELSRALVAGGIRALEVTMTVPDAPRAISQLRAEFGAQVIVGAGTVTDPTELAACLTAGSEFIVTPVCVPELAAACRAAGVPVALGALTPTEVWQAHRAGADIVKVFPASALGGAAYLSALRGPFPHIQLMPTGGVTLTTIAEYVAAGARVLGVGTALADPRLLKVEGAGAVTALARKYCEAFGSAIA